MVGTLSVSAFPSHDEAIPGVGATPSPEFLWGARPLLALSQTALPTPHPGSGAFPKSQVQVGK